MTTRSAASLISLLSRLLVFLLALAVILFLSAGRISWIQGWLFIFAFGGYLAFYGFWVRRNDPGQMVERSKAGQNTKGWDKVLLTVYTILLFAMLILAGLDAGRFTWSPAPLIWQGLGWLGAIFAGSIIFWTVSVNTFLSRTVRI
jgi:hypothetical protein